MVPTKVNTRYGELNVDPEKVITFPRGLPGFEKNTKWYLFHEVNDKGECVNGVVVHLQSLEDNEVTMSLTDPTIFGFNFDLVLTDSETAELKLKDPDDVLVLTTLSTKNVVPQNGGGLPLANLNTNISAPILINTKERVGMQKILTGKESKVDFRPMALV
ncbi:MAG TPA: flagellar assembly protein FliW [Gallionella sp.]|nr:flagellar assembly protein FliW [Gallionella sp.]